MGLNAPGNVPAQLLLFPTRIVAQYLEPIGTLWSCQVLVRKLEMPRWSSTMLFSATHPTPLKNDLTILSFI